MGMTIVQLDATTTAETLEAGGVPGIDRAQCIDGVERPRRFLVSFQLLLSADTKNIGFTYVEGQDRVTSDAKLNALPAFVFGR
jgi:hypothetical protein